MLKFSKTKIFLITLIAISAIFFSLPSFFRNSKILEKIPHNKVGLGLDLRGGSHLLLEVGFNQYIQEQLENLKEDIKNLLRDGAIKITHEIAGDKLIITVNETKDSEEAIKIIKKNYPKIDIKHSEDKMQLSFSNTEISEMKKNLIKQSIEILRRRIDENGTKEPTIQPQGDSQILLQVPQSDANNKNLDNQNLKEIIGRTAKMSFRFVSEKTIDNSLVISSSINTETIYDNEGNPYSIEKPIILGGELLISANPTYYQGEPAVAFRFNNIGAKKFAQITKENIGRFFAVVLDNKVVTAPRINSVINQGSGIISGSFTIKEATQVALLLRAGALPAPLKIVEERTIGPSLGQDSIKQGAIASVAGIIFVAIFMITFYGLFGLFANIAMIINVMAIITILSMIGATLTLPGIAGIVLTMGMAVDANVLIFERIKEELRSKQKPIIAIEQGFSQAFRTIADSNITTLIVAFFLYAFGSGSVKGFAVTLSIGILASMFSAILLTRMMIALYLKFLSKRRKIIKLNLI